MPIFEQDAGQYRRHVAGRVGVCAGQPEMQRHHAGLEARTPARRPGISPCADPIPPVPVPAAAIQTSRKPPAAWQTARTGTASQCASPPDTARPHRELRLLLFGADKEERRQGHHFPGEQERDGVGRQHHHRHRRYKQAIKQNAASARSRVRLLAPIAKAINRFRPLRPQNRKQKERRQRIQMKVEGQFGQWPRQIGRRTAPRPQGRHRRRDTQQRSHHHHRWRPVLPAPLCARRRKAPARRWRRAVQPPSIRQIKPHPAHPFRSSCGLGLAPLSVQSGRRCAVNGRLHSPPVPRRYHREKPAQAPSF